MKFKRIVILLSILVNIGVYSEDKEKHEFIYEFGIKNVSGYYEPIEYYRFDGLGDSFTPSYKDKIGNNNINFQPIYFNLKNVDDFYEIQIGYQNFNINRANYLNFTFHPLRGPGIAKQYFFNTDRTEYKINYLKNIFKNNPEILGLGVGIRKIDRFTNQESILYYYEEKFNTQGLQLVLNSEFNLFGKLYFNSSIEYYLTYGDRSSKESNANRIFTSEGEFAVFRGMLTNENTKAIFQGYEVDLSFKYKYDDRLNFSVGLLTNESMFSYRNYRDILYQASNNERFRGFSILDRGGGSIEFYQGIYFGISLIN